jgi:hypothetical protein
MQELLPSLREQRGCHRNHNPTRVQLRQQHSMVPVQVQEQQHSMVPVQVQVHNTVPVLVQEHSMVPVRVHSMVPVLVRSS